MDCKTARLLLEYARPASAELDPTEARALDEHLSGCETCDQLCRAERRADEAVGKAMREVEVPDQLRARILARMKRERGDRRRPWIAYGLCGAAAAALLLLTLGLLHWYAPRPAFPVAAYGNEAITLVVAPPGAAQVEAMLKERGVEMSVPDLNYSRMRWMFMTNVESRPTPLLFFNNDGEDGSRPQHAFVFLVADDQFDLNALHTPTLTYAYEYKCVTAVQEKGGKRTGYVVYYTGADWDWLKSPLSPPDVANGN